MFQQSVFLFVMLCLAGFSLSAPTERSRGLKPPVRDAAKCNELQKVQETPLKVCRIYLGQVLA